MMATRKRSAALHIAILVAGLVAPFVFPGHSVQFAVFWIMVLFALTWDALPAKLRAQQFVDLDPDDVIAEYRRLYPAYTPSEVFFAATTAGRSWRGAVEELEARARAGHDTWAYQLDWHPDTDEGRRSRAFHTLVSAHIVRGQYAHARRPILLNNWEATYFHFNEEHKT